MTSSRATPGATRVDYTTVGHVTCDVLEDGTRRPGGGAFYSALQAARLGWRTLILTKGEPRELDELLAPYRDEVEVRVLPAENTTTLATSGMGAQRRQRVLAWAGPISEALEVDTAILHLAAVARETPTHWSGQADFVGLTPQGLVREWTKDGEVRLTQLDPRSLPGRLDALVLSDRERACCEGSIAGASVVAVTAGAQPTEVRLADGTVEHVPVSAAGEPRDDLGAGDVFAAAFFIALHDGRTTTDAAAYGNAAAATRIAGLDETFRRCRALRSASCVTTPGPATCGSFRMRSSAR